jgi:Ca2+-binding RTX toxin-like protein
MRSAVGLAFLSIFASVAIGFNAPAAWAATSYCDNKIADIVGTDASETLYGNSLDNVVAAKGGNDTVWPLTGSDTVCGGDGNDVVHGDDGNDVEEGLAGTDTLYGGNGNDDLHGGTGDDTLFGGLGNNNFYGGDGYDVAHTCVSWPSGQFFDSIEHLVTDNC